MLNTARFTEKSAVCRSWCTLLFYICNHEYRMRLGIAKSEMGFPLVFALAFRYICKHEYRIRFGIVKSEMNFPFVSALTFYYLCQKQR